LYDKAACNVHTNNVGPAFFWKNNLVALEFLLVGHHQRQEKKGELMTQQNKQETKTQLCLVQNQLQCFLVFFVAFLS